MVKRWIESILQSVVATLVIALVPSAGVAYLAKIGSQWTSPLFLGAGAGLMSLLFLFILRKQIAMPVRRILPSIENIEALVRSWLINFRVSVKDDPRTDAYFHVLATFDSAVQLSIGRPREALGGYLIVRHDINPTPEEIEKISKLPGDKATRLVLRIRLELAHFKVGYSAIGPPLKPFGVFKRIPIDENLTEHLFIDATDEVEAAVHAIALIFLLTLQGDEAKEIIQIYQ